MRLTLEAIARATGGRLDPPGAAGAVSGVSTDTRRLQPGDLFVPLRGPHRDGHDFIAEAFRLGAAASLAGPRAGAGPPGGAPGVVVRVDDTLRALGDLAGYYRRTLRVQVVGITGSVGKTTTAAMVAAVLATAHRVARTREEWNAEIGVPLTLLGLRPDDEVAVIEMAMRGLGQIAELVAMAAPEIGVITNIGPSHLELLGTLEQVARAKGELLEGLPPGGAAVLNADDARVMGVAGRTRAPVWTYGLDRPADVRAEAVTFTPEGMRFCLVRRDGSADVRVPTWGRHNVSNALAAAAVGQVLGIPPDGVRRGLAQVTLPQMRLQPVRIGDVLVINDAYNASPASMAAAFEVLAQVGGARRRVAVLGEMKELGASSAAMHHEVGAAAARVAALLIVVGGEDASAMAQGAAASGRGDAHHAASPAEAAALLRELWRPQDVVLVKGSRAMAMERVVWALDAVPQPRPEGRS